MNQTDPEALDLCVHNVRFGFWDNLRWAGRKENTCLRLTDFVNIVWVTRLQRWDFSSKSQLYED